MLTISMLPLDRLSPAGLLQNKSKSTQIRFNSTFPSVMVGNENAHVIT